MPVEIIKSDTHIDFIGKWRICIALSLALLLAGVVGVFTRGFRLGIDFAGGTEVQIRFDPGVSVEEGAIRKVVTGLHISNPSVVRYGSGGNAYLVKFQGRRELASEKPEARKPTQAGLPPRSRGQGVTAKTDRILALEAALEQQIGPLQVERVEFVGPKVGAELRRDGLAAIGIACLLILAYIAIRFSARFAPGAVIALIHDVLITSSLWILLGLEFDLRVLAALLAIIGYSLNDTIIVYDRIRENLELRTKRDLMEVLNLSVNQTL